MASIARLLPGRFPEAEVDGLSSAVKSAVDGGKTKPLTLFVGAGQRLRCSRESGGAAAILAVVLAGVAGHRLTLLVIVASIGATALGKLSYQLQKAVVQRIRSGRGPGGS